MGWNNRDWNNDRRSGGGGWGNGYNNNRGYDDRRSYRDDRRGGYDRFDRDDRDRRDYPPQQQFAFNVGQKCTLKDYPDVVVSIIRQGREQYECRLPNLSTQWFYEHELQAIQE